MLFIVHLIIGLQGDSWLALEYEMEPIHHPFILEFIVEHPWFYFEPFQTFPKLWDILWENNTLTLRVTMIKK